MKSAGLVILFLILCSIGSIGAAQRAAAPPVSGVTGATVSPKSSKFEIYVDPYGEDTNPGTEGAPLKTIRAAIRRAVTNQENGQAARILLTPGTYRESLNLDASKPVKSNAAIVIEPTEANRVIVTGADEFRSGWLSTETPSVFHSDTPTGLQPLPDDASLGRAMVYVNDDPYWLVSNRTELAPYRAYVEPVSQRLFLQTPAGTSLRSLATARIEIVRRNFLVRIQRPHVVLRGLRFERSSLIGGTVAAQDVLMEDCTFVQNAATGLLIEDSEAITLHRMRLSRNASAGLYVRRSKNLLIENAETAENDDGSDAAERAGVILTDVRGARFVGLHSLHNRAHGLRMEGSTGDITLTDCQFIDNLRSGVTGAIAAPLTLLNCQIRDNTRGLEVIGGSVALRGCTIADNSEAQVRIMTGIGPTTWENTTITSSSGNAALLMADAQDEATWKAFLSAFRGKDNVYFRPAPTAKAPNDLSPASLEEWNRWTEGRDVGASWKEPASSDAGTVMLTQETDRLTATVSGAKAAIVKVGFYDRNRYLWSERTKGPYVLLLSSLPPGEHVITAWATDKNGRLLRSNPVSVTAK